MPIAAIVLAAGASRRLGQPKQLLRIGGETLLQRTIRLANEAGAEPVVIVLGANYNAIGTSAPLVDCVVVRNEEWRTGIAGSIRAGLNTLTSNAADCEGAMLLVCDQPRLSAEHLRALTLEFVSRGGAAAVASGYEDALGVPAVFPRSTFVDLLRLTGDQGARALLRNPPCEVVEIPFPGGGLDIDRPEDLAEFE